MHPSDMKTLTLLAALSLSIPAALAEPPPGMPPGPGQKPGEMARDHMMKRLPPEERERFEAARKKALEDPEIAALRNKAETSNREFFEAMKAKMNEIDPGLKDILKKQMGERKGKPEGNKPRDGKHPEKGGFAGLDEAERQRLLAAREVAKQTPAVQAAEAKREAAKTPEERESAGREFAAAMRTAMLQADPSLAPILDKVAPPRQAPEKKEDPVPPPME